MGKFKRIIGCLLLVILTINILPSIEIKATLSEGEIGGNKDLRAEISDINIVSNTNVTVENAKEWARKKGATQTFINLADLFWKYSPTNGNVNPAIAYVQSAKETGYGKFGGVIDETYFNTCGMKNSEGGGDYEPGAHYRFKNWDEGVQAQLDHLALYAGAASYPRSNSPDPRHFPYLNGKAPTVKSLGGKWAPSSTYGIEIFNLYYNLLEVSNLVPKLENRLMIDTVKLNGSLLNVSGWALNSAGMKEVKIYIDDVFKGNATYGMERTDVGNAYPLYPNSSKSGYEKQLDVSDVKDGDRSVRIEAVGNDGTVKSDKRTVTFKKEPKYPNRINIDVPNENESVKNNLLEVSGWALNASGVKEVKTYIDGKYVGNANYGLSRTDVGKAYPEYVDAYNSGYEAKIDVKSFTAGKKILTIEAIGNDGIASRMEKAINISRKAAIIDIDSPIQNEVIKNDSLNVKGWALNDSGVKEVKVYIDGKYINNAKYGLDRSDVNNAFPGYTNGLKSGYELTIDVNNIEAGNRKVLVESIGFDGAKASVERVVSIVRTPSKLYVDSPNQNEVVKNNSVSVRGWALNSSGVKEVKVYVDDKYIKNAEYGIERPDVNNAYPGYQNGDKSGYELNLDLKSIQSGNRKITIEAIGFNGLALKEDRIINISRKPTIINIDLPSQNGVIKGDSLYIRGWALNDSGVKEIKVYLDNKYMGNANYGLSRTDVNSAYPGYVNGDKSGYEQNIDIKNIEPGNKTITVEVIGIDGTSTKLERNVSIARKPALIDIDSPTMNYKVTNNSLYVSGWALNASGVKSVKVFIDGKDMGNAEYGIIRDDVNNAYPGYTNGNKSGYSMTVDLSTIQTGDRNVIVEAIGFDGVSARVQRTISIVRKPARIDIDEPIQNKNITENYLNVRGWSLDDSGVKEVKIYIDGKFMTSAVYGSSRTDVNSAFPGYVNGDKSGYEAKVDLSNVSSGTKKITVESVGHDGKSVIVERNVNIQRTSDLPGLMDINDPINSVVVSNEKLYVRGWALNGTGIKEIKIFADGKYKGNASYGLNRPDVNATYPGYLNGDKSGYELTIDMSNIASGDRNIEVQAVGNDGKITTMTKVVKILPRGSKPARMDIDEPVDNSINLFATMKVRGWALNDSGIKEVQIYINDVFVKNAQIRIDRPDVNAAFPAYADGENGGYEATIDVSSLPKGHNVVKVVAIGYDNSSVGMTRVVRNTNSKLIVIDPGHNYVGDSGSSATHNGIRYIEDNLNMQVAIKLKAELVAMGYEVAMTVEPRIYLMEYNDERLLRESLKRRVDFANSRNADLFVSIHHDSAGSSAVGVTGFYSSYKPNLDQSGIVEMPGWGGSVNVDTTPTQQALKGKTICENIINNMASKAGYNNRGSNDYEMYVTKHTTMPAVLIENGFLSNPNEAARLADPNEQLKKARIIADEIKKGL